MDFAAFERGGQLVLSDGVGRDRIGLGRRVTSVVVLGAFGGDVLAGGAALALLPHAANVRHAPATSTPVIPPNRRIAPVPVSAYEPADGRATGGADWGTGAGAGVVSVTGATPAAGAGGFAMPSLRYAPSALWIAAAVLLPAAASRSVGCTGRVATSGCV